MPISENTLATLLGVLLGYLLSAASTWIRESRKNKAIREIIRLEIQSNLDRLKESADVLPTRSTNLYSSQLPALPGALGPKKLRKVHDFYIDLNEIYKLSSSQGRNRPKTDKVTDKIQQLVSIGNPL